MSRDKAYQKLLNSKRWKELRVQYLQAHPLCERCQAEGYVRAAIDLHHRVPVESAKSQQEMERLCFDPNNLQALCVPCHVAVHKAMGKNTRANMKAREAERLERWKDRVRAMSEPRDPAPVIFVEAPSDSEISLQSSVSIDTVSKSDFYPE